MGALTAAALLDAWERNLARPLPGRVLALLAAAFPEASVEELAELPIGRRDARLLRLREQLFGPEFTVVTQCPACGEHVESSFCANDIRLADEMVPDGPHSTEIDGYHATFRLPTTQDLLTLTDASMAHQALLARCLIKASNANGEAVMLESVPETVIAAIAARMAAIDAQADIELRLTCPACDHRWPAVFDIASSLWKELHAWALRTLRDVHSLARSYGWSEADVLALSPTRRQVYLELSRQ